MIHKKKPKNFKSKFDCIGCVVEEAGEILLLHRQNHKPQGNTWGIPSGKVDENEKLEETLVREVFEETGINILAENSKYHGELYVRFDDYDFVYHLYHIGIGSRPKVKTNPKEHKSYKWISPNKTLDLDLIEDLDGCLEIIYNISKA